MTKKSSNIILFSLLCAISILLTNCRMKDSIDYSSLKDQEPPVLETLSSNYNLNFTYMHNYVIDTLTENFTPFFYIKDNSFFVDGDNEKKTISVSCICLDGTTIHDLDLFLSMVLNAIGINASEQDFRFAPPKTDNDGTYLDFGGVFNTYTLIIDTKTENNQVLRNHTIRPGSKIPVESKYIME